MTDSLDFARLTDDELNDSLRNITESEPLREMEYSLAISICRELVRRLQVEVVELRHNLEQHLVHCPTATAA